MCDGVRQISVQGLDVRQGCAKSAARRLMCDSGAPNVGVSRIRRSPRPLLFDNADATIYRYLTHETQFHSEKTLSNYFCILYLFARSYVKTRVIFDLFLTNACRSSGPDTDFMRENTCSTHTSSKSVRQNTYRTRMALIFS